MGTPIELRVKRKEIADACGIKYLDVRCYYCKAWGYNCGKTMNSVGQSQCIIRKERTDSYLWCKKFKYVGKNT